MTRRRAILEAYSSLLQGGVTQHPSQASVRGLRLDSKRWIRTTRGASRHTQCAGLAAGVKRQPMAPSSAEIPALPLEPDSKVVAEILDEISTEEDGAGRGMHSAGVVHADDWFPGAGFFSLGTALGRDTSPRLEIHVSELARVHEAHRG